MRLSHAQSQISKQWACTCTVARKAVVKQCLKLPSKHRRRALKTGIAEGLQAHMRQKACSNLLKQSFWRTSKGVPGNLQWGDQVTGALESHLSLHDANQDTCSVPRSQQVKVQLLQYLRQLLIFGTFCFQVGCACASQSALTWAGSQDGFLWLASLWLT